MEVLPGLIDDLADLPDDAHALISFTSGTSGTPKAIARSHGFLAAQDRAVAPLLRSASPQVDLVGFPVFVVAALGRGDTSVLPNWPLGRPDRADAAAIARHCADAGVGRLLLSPAVAERLAEGGVPPHIVTLFVGGGPVFPDLVDRLRHRAPNLRIVAVYGSTEAEPIAHCELTGLQPEGEAYGSSAASTHASAASGRSSWRRAHAHGAASRALPSLGLQARSCSPSKVTPPTCRSGEPSSVDCATVKSVG